MDEEEAEQAAVPAAAAIKPETQKEVPTPAESSPATPAESSTVPCGTVQRASTSAGAKALSGVASTKDGITNASAAPSRNATSEQGEETNGSEMETEASTKRRREELGETQALKDDGDWKVSGGKKKRNAATQPRASSLPRQKPAL